MSRPGSNGKKAFRILVRGLVQGVGFRPFVYRIAMENGLTGWVKNTTGGVELKIQGPAAGCAAFLRDLEQTPPPLSRIENIVPEETPWEEDEEGFRIIQSLKSAGSITRVSPDVGVCEDCLKDMRVQPNRIHYPFTNCTNCGPRFSIIRDIPYDRAKTTMADFTMCPACRGEYEDITDRRFHAQPNACSECGPECTFTAGTYSSSDIETVLEKTAAVIDGGGGVAVKGIGGFHIMCDALNEEAVGLLRERKRREAKPFALMTRDLETARRYAVLDEAGEELLTSFRKPIVLLKCRRKPAPSVAYGLDTLGIMLPYTPFHVLLFERLGTDLIVATSGNLSDEPIVIDNDDAFRRLGSLVDAFVTYNRDIHNRCDDSVAMSVRGAPRLIRRSRGYVPEPVTLDIETEGIAAFGAELKNTFCIGRGHEAILSQHLGDLDTAETFDFFSESYRRFRRLFRFTPSLGVCDLHPDYMSTAYCRESGLPYLQVQHHHAHIAACMAENRVGGEVIGVSLDGTGYGEDGAVWGGEFLVCGYESYLRYAHLQYVPLPGGNAAVREPWRMGVSWLYSVYGEGFFDLDIPFVHGLDRSKTGLLLEVMRKKGSYPYTSSTGRLFDALSAVLGLVETARFEAEAPMKLEGSIEDTDDMYPFIWGEAIGLAPLWQGIVKDIKHGESTGLIACRFHNTVAAIVLDAAVRISADTGLDRVALSGGVFQNRYLLTRCERMLESAGFTVLSHRAVPANDGGISLGQMAVAAGRRAGGLI